MVFIWAEFWGRWKYWVEFEVPLLSSVNLSSVGMNSDLLGILLYHTWREVRFRFWSLIPVQSTNQGVDGGDVDGVDVVDNSGDVGGVQGGGGGVWIIFLGVFSCGGGLARSL